MLREIFELKNSWWMRLQFSNLVSAPVISVERVAVNGPQPAIEELSKARVFLKLPLYAYCVSSILIALFSLPRPMSEVISKIFPASNF